MSLDRETVASYTLILEAIGKDFPPFPRDRCHAATRGGRAHAELPCRHGRETATFEALCKPKPVFGVSISQPTCINPSRFYRDFRRE